jgi:hypothetical protein
MWSMTGSLLMITDLGLGLVECADLAGLAVPGVRRVEHAGQRDVLAHHRGREGLGDPVAERVREAEHPGGVLHRGLGLDRAVGDDLRDPVVPVLLGDVADHVAAPALVEVDVDVGHRDALGVEEPLEHQPVRDRIQVGDAERVGHHGPGGRAAAGTDPDAGRLGPVDEVGHDQEVGAESHLRDHADLVLGAAPALLVVAAGEAAVHAEPDLAAQPAFLGLAVRYREAGHQVLLGEAHLAALRDQQGRVAACLPLGVGGDRAHLGRGLDVIAAAVELEPAGVGQVGPGLHAQQHLMRLRVAGAGVVRVVGDDEREREVGRDRAQAVTDLALDVQAVVHDLDEEIARAEDVAVAGGRVDGLLVLAELEPGLYLAGRAAGGGDDARGVGGKQLAVHPRLAEEALQGGERGQPEQVVHALGGLGEQRHVGIRAGPGDVVGGLGGAAPAHRLAVLAVLGGDVGLDPDHRLDAGRGGLRPEVVGTVEVAVVGHGDGRHAILLALGEQVLQPGRAVQHRVLGVHVQVDERGPAPRRGSRHVDTASFRHA